jgi:hypothetical protein
MIRVSTDVAEWMSGVVEMPTMAASCIGATCVLVRLESELGLSTSKCAAIDGLFQGVRLFFSRYFCKSFIKIIIIPERCLFR